MKKSLQNVVGKLENLFSTFNETYYNGQMQVPVITVSPDQTSGSYGWCTAWKAWKEDKSEEGFYEINICAEHLNRPFTETCATLLHEMVHLWCLQNEIKDTSRGGSYHNKKFKEIAEQHGLIISKDETYGWTLTKLNDASKDLINSMQEQKFDLYRTKLEKTKSSKKSSSRKYVCPNCGIIVRATKEVRIICSDCDMEMELEE